MAVIAIVVRESRFREKATRFDEAVDRPLRCLVPTDIESKQLRKELQLAVWKIVMNPPCHCLPAHRVHSIDQPDPALVVASYAKNAHIRTEGTRNLIAAAQAAAAQRFIVQSIAFAYAPQKPANDGHFLEERFPGRGSGKPSESSVEPHPETDPLDLADPIRSVTVKGAADMEGQVLSASELDAIVLRYGFLYGPGTWHEAPTRKPGLHVDAAAHPALLAITQGAAGVYNIADDDSVVSIAKARAELGFDPRFRLS